MKPVILYATGGSLLAALGALASSALPFAGLAQEPRQSQARSNEFEALLKVDAPIVLCIDDKPSTGGQPTDHAYANAAANGFRSVLTLRAHSDGVDLMRERLMVEKNQLRYFNLPVLAPLPKFAQVDEFLGLLRDKRNQPMLINCAFAERVAPYMMIFNLVERGWTEERAVEDASQSGVRRNVIREFARSFLKARAANSSSHRSDR